MYKVKLTKTAERTLGRLEKRFHRPIVESVYELGTNPRPEGCKKLHGGKNLYRIRVGDYRVIYEIKDQELIVYVIQIGHRREVYR